VELTIEGQKTLHSKDAEDDAEDIVLNNAMIDTALTDASKNIFPHRALEIQKLSCPSQSY
jgi:hypothetical protein